MTARFWGVPISHVVYHKLVEAANKLQINISQLDGYIYMDHVYVVYYNNVNTTPQSVLMFSSCLHL